MSNQQTFNVIKKNVPNGQRRDVYHYLLKISWLKVFFIYVLFFLFINILFAILYLLVFRLLVMILKMLFSLAYKLFPQLGMEQFHQSVYMEISLLFWKL